MHSLFSGCAVGVKGHGNLVMAWRFSAVLDGDKGAKLVQLGGGVSVEAKKRSNSTSILCHKASNVSTRFNIVFIVLLI